MLSPIKTVLVISSTIGCPDPSVTITKKYEINSDYSYEAQKYKSNTESKESEFLSDILYKAIHDENKDK